MRDSAATAQLTLWSGDDRPPEWIVRESRRARRLTVRVFHTGRVEVVVPTRTPRLAVASFIDSHRPWIELQQLRARRHPVVAEAFPPPCIDLCACGEQWRVHLAGGAGRVRVRAAGGLISITGVARTSHELREILRAWLIGRAREVLGVALAECARELGFEYQRLSVRRQRTRWGSCSSRGTISLNCCLLFQRPEVVRYLLIHELAHTRYMNHSRRFWQCVGECCADFRRLDRELVEGWRRVPSWVFGEERAALPAGGWP